MNTSDTEWEEEFTEWACDYMGSRSKEEASKARQDLAVLISKLLTSRDTYWKERVEKLKHKAPEEVDDHHKIYSEYDCVIAQNTILEELTTPITNEDNLK